MFSSYSLINFLLIEVIIQVEEKKNHLVQWTWTIFKSIKKYISTEGKWNKSAARGGWNLEPTNGFSCFLYFFFLG